MIRRFPVDGECPWTVGGTVRRKLPRVPGLPLVHVTDVREQRLRTISHKDALGEGFQGNRARQAFMLDWVRRHDKWARRHRRASDAQIMEAWATRFANRAVWVVTLEIIHVETERFLAHQRPLSGHTHNGNGQYAPTASIDRLPVIPASNDDVMTARRNGAAVRSERLIDQREQAAAVRAARNTDRGRLRARRARD
jgi:hypothetical protein